MGHPWPHCMGVRSGTGPRPLLRCQKLTCILPCRRGAGHVLMCSMAVPETPAPAGLPHCLEPPLSLTCSGLCLVTKYECLQSHTA